MVDIFLLSLIQGITEFLPVSSSGHLIILPHILGMPTHSLEIDGMVHMGTLWAVVLYFFKDIRTMVYGFFGVICLQKKDADLKRQAVLAISVIMATLPVVVVGLLLKKCGMDMVRTPFVIGVASIVGGVCLYVADRVDVTKHGMEDINVKNAFIIGLFQIFSLIPGSSRSGMCLIGARLLGFDRSSATRFAFLLSIPAILGAFTLIFFDAYRDGLQTPIGELLGYFALSFVFGLCAIHFMIRYVQRHSFFAFMVYRLLLGGAILFLAS